jgi:DNA-directed RNA polymerase specialized sigma24 family protein
MPKTIEDRANKEIAAITSIPIGTVMSSLPRTRRLYSVLANSTHKEAVREV